jgi:hypothetical protein
MGFLVIYIVSAKSHNMRSSESSEVGMHIDFVPVLPPEAF